MRKITGKKRLGGLLALSLMLGYSSTIYAASASDYSSTQEYQNSTGLAMIRAADAYALGATGKGITLGITDEFVRLSHQEFNDKSGSSYIYNRPPTNYDWTKHAHGTHVAGTMVASRNGLGMHGVAFDADIIGDEALIDTFVLAKVYDVLNQRPEIKVINHSWVTVRYNDELIMDDFDDPDPEWRNDVNIMKNSIKHDKLLVFSAGNYGHSSSGINWGEVARDFRVNKNIILVMAANPDTSKYSVDDDGRVKEVNSDFLAAFSDLAKYGEESAIISPAVNINSTFSKELDQYTYKSGTSMAAPHVSGVAGLTQQVFPYMSSKQLADVVLSSANKDFALPNFTLTVQEEFNWETEDEKLERNKVNLYYFGGVPVNGAADIKADLREYYNTNKKLLKTFHKIDTLDEFIDFAIGNAQLEPGDNPQFKDSNISIYYNVPREMVFGQGILDAYAAVRGPAQLNARRLAAADKDTLYTSNTRGQALYKIDTQGYNSVWANDISEVQAGLLAADSSQEDLKGIYNYYLQGDVIYSEDKPGFAEGQKYMDAYNANATANGLIDLHVGLYKTGAGILALTGDNSYQGSTIAAGGTVQIDGKVASAAYSLAGATLAGSGNINGDLINQGTVQAGSYEVVNEIWLNPSNFKTGTLTVSGGLESNNGTIAVASNDAANISSLNITGVANVASARLIGVHGSIYKPDTNYAGFLTAGDINGTFAQDNAFTGMLSADVTVNNNQADFKLRIANNMQLDNNGSQTFAAMSKMYYSLSDNEREPMLKLLSMQTKQAQKATAELHTNNSTAMAGSIQNNTAMVRSINTRLTTVQNQNVSMPIHGLSNSQIVDVVVPLEFDASNSWWFKLNKGWGSVNALGDQAEISQNSFGAIIGRDVKVSDKWRIGAMFNYRNNTLSSADGSGNTYDYSLGVYAGYHYLAHDLSSYLAAGIQNNTIKRNLTQLSLNTQGKYNSNTIQLGMRYTYNTAYGKDSKWAVKPYAGLDYTYYRQNGYSETGAGIFNQQVESMHNNYLTGELGLEFAHQGKNGEYYLRTGYKRVLSGANPDLTIAYAGNSAYKTRISSDRDSRNLLVVDLGANISMQNNWYVDMQLSGEFGNKSKQTGAALTVRRTW